MKTIQNENGFTLIEIAIVLVIIGLLLGGVLKGQELITSARVRNLISQQDGIKAAFYGFQDRFRAFPGDYAQAATVGSVTGNISGATANGNGNGRIEYSGSTGWAAVNSSVAYEDNLVWEHLSRSGFINGTYSYAAGTPTDTVAPKNPYGVYLELAYDGEFGSATTQASTPIKHNLKTGAQIPVEIIAEVDRKVDDGLPFSGAFQFSDYQGNAAAKPPVGTCTTGTGASATWATTGGETNCQGASLF